MTSDDAALRLVFESARLESLTGAARAAHLRYKPGTGLTVALLNHDDVPVGWLRTVRDGGEAKITNARRRAARRGLTLQSTRFDGGSAFWGPIDADPGLDRALREIDVELTQNWEVLRYNPLRRLVVALPQEKVAGRLTQEPQNRLKDDVARVARQAPTVARVKPDGLPSTSRITWWDWCEGGDLTKSPTPPSVREAGEITALLHRVAPPPARDMRASVEAQLGANAQQIATLDDQLGSWLQAAVNTLLPRLKPGAAVTVHGDLSADQFLLKNTRVRLGDLDRMAAGPPAADVGSFAATSPELLTDFLAGYGAAPAPAALTAWTAYAHAIRITEPFRAVAPDWRDQVAQRIHTIEELL